MQFESAYDISAQFCAGKITRRRLKNSLLIFVIVFFVLGHKQISNIRQNERSTWGVPSQESVDQRPYFLIGIKSADDHREIRDLDRATMLSSIRRLDTELPFRVVYKFLMDNPVNDLRNAEQEIYNDILYINDTNRGWVNKWGYMLHYWYQYVHNNYPEATLAAIMDDDTFLCVPQIFNRLDNLNSKTLYYGWTHNGGPKFDKDRYYLDGLFLVIGRESLKRIVKRKYCDGEHCNKSVDAVEQEYDDLSLNLWLAAYNDINYVADNPSMLQVGRLGNMSHILEHVKPGFCSKYVLCHKSSMEVMKKLHEYNKDEI